MQALLLSIFLCAPTQEGLRYEFDRPAELRDFRPEEGSWAVQAGALVCRTKGDEDAIRWRRSLEAVQRIRLDVGSTGPCALELFGGAGSAISVRVHRRAGSLEIRSEGRTLRRIPFENPGRAPLRIEVFLGPELMLRVGDDETVTVAVDPRGCRSVRLRSFEEQTRFTRLSFVRRQGAFDEVAEDRALTLEDVRTRAAAGEVRPAFELLIPLASEATRAGPPSRDWPADLLAALQSLAVLEPGLRHREPLRSLAADAAVLSRDGSAGLSAPLTPGWHLELYPARRVDGTLLALRHLEDDVEVELRRYDQRFEYWFGEEPRVRLVGGGDSASLAEARLADLRVEWQGIRVPTSPRKASERLADQETVEWSLDYQRAPGTMDRGPRSRHERYARFRGDTYRWSEDGAPTALERHSDALRWMRHTLTLQPRSDPR